MTSLEKHTSISTSHASGRISNHYSRKQVAGPEP